jgi:hypothetical protein
MLTRLSSTAGLIESHSARRTPRAHEPSRNDEDDDDDGDDGDGDELCRSVGGLGGECNRW